MSEPVQNSGYVIGNAFRKRTQVVAIAPIGRVGCADRQSTARQRIRRSSRSATDQMGMRLDQTGKLFAIMGIAAGSPAHHPGTGAICATPRLSISDTLASRAANNLPFAGIGLIDNPGLMANHNHNISLFRPARI